MNKSFDFLAVIIAIIVFSVFLFLTIYARRRVLRNTIIVPKLNHGEQFTVTIPGEYGVWANSDDFFFGRYTAQGASIADTFNQIIRTFSSFQPLATGSVFSVRSIELFSFKAQQPGNYTLYVTHLLRVPPHQYPQAYHKSLSTYYTIRTKVSSAWGFVFIFSLMFAIFAFMGIFTVFFISLGW